MALAISDLQTVVNKIVNDYKKIFNNNIDLKRIRTSIGFQISSLKKYEIDNGIYPARSVTILPKSTRIVDILLVYHSEHGDIKYELIIRPYNIDNYYIYKNSITPYNNKETNTDTTIKLSSSINTNHKIEKSSTRRKPPQTLPNKSNTYLCRSKDINCCYTNKDHQRIMCNDCCYDQEHIVI